MRIRGVETASRMPVNLGRATVRASGSSEIVLGRFEGLVPLFDFFYRLAKVGWGFGDRGIAPSGADYPGVS